MNTKRILLLVIMFLFLFIVAENSVYATNINDNIGIGPVITTISNELKQILNEEGKLVVTDTTMAEDKFKFIKEYVDKYNGDGEYWFEVISYNEENSTCDITVHGGILQTYNIEIVYEENVSDDFKNILTDGKLKVQFSTKNGVGEKLSSYLGNISELNENYTFNVATYGVLNEEESLPEDPVYEEVPYIDENYTKVTIQMKNKNNGKLLEQHVVELSYLTEKSEEFKKILNKDEKLVFNSVKPNNEDELWALFEVLFVANNEDKGYRVEYPSDDYSSVDLTINSWTDKEETHRVEIVYNYNEGINKKFQEFRKNFPKDLDYFYVRDFELLNYWINNVESDDTVNLDDYSGELKSAINNNNIEFYVYNMMGWNDAFNMGRGGIATFRFNNIIYYVDPGLGTQADCIIYVPDETGDSKEELMVAAQNRIDEYLGENEKVEVKLSYDAIVKYAWSKSMYDTGCYGWQEENPNMTLEEWMVNYIPEYEDFGRDVMGVEGINENDHAFIIKVKVGNKEKNFHVVIKKDSSKMVNPKYRTVDMETNIEINSDDSSIPLDTHIKAEKVTDGKEYERIIKILGLKDNEMFDLKLYSDSLEDYIKKLPNGEFEVRIPISEEFKHKDFKAYYVDEDGKVEKYDITKKDGYAIFRTKHFSIYTLAEEKVEIYSLTLDANEGKFSNDKIKLEFEDVTKCDMTKIENPVRDGYTFKGWYTEKTGGESIETVMSSEDGIKEDITFYAQWEAITSGEEPGIPEGEEQEENNNIENEGESNNSTNDEKVPETGDDILLFIGLFIISALGMRFAIKINKYIKY